MSRIVKVALVVALAYVVWVVVDGRDAGPFRPPAAQEADARLADLRDEAIRNIGWVAGNARGHPIWPEVREYVGKGGQHYNAFVLLSAGGGDSEAEAYANVSLYNDWVARGEDHRFDEKEALSRIRRVNQIAAELSRHLSR